MNKTVIKEILRRLTLSFCFSNPGVQYTIDSVSGHCDIKPLARWRNDIITDREATDINGVRYLKMNSPNELFQMNGIYFKKGLVSHP